MKYLIIRALVLSCCTTIDCDFEKRTLAIGCFHSVQGAKMDHLV